MIANKSSEWIVDKAGNPPSFQTEPGKRVSNIIFAPACIRSPGAASIPTAGVRADSGESCILPVSVDKIHICLLFESSAPYCPFKRKSVRAVLFKNISVCLPLNPCRAAFQTSEPVPRLPLSYLRVLSSAELRAPTEFHCFLRRFSCKQSIEKPAGKSVAAAYAVHDIEFACR